MCRYRTGWTRGRMLVLVALLGVASPGWADFVEGLQAYMRGDDATAVQEFRVLAVQGNANAQFYLGVMYNDGRGVPQDYEQALHWYRRAAERGVAEAQLNLGVMYNAGRGVPQDYGQALHWFRRAAERGLASAQFNLGMMHEEGQGVPQDYALSLYWYRQAAAQGHAGAQNNLGVMHEHGQGVPQDYVNAYFLYNLAAARSPAGRERERAVRNRDRMAARLTPAQLAEAQARARAWHPALSPSYSSHPLDTGGVLPAKQQEADSQEGASAGRSLWDQLGLDEAAVGAASRQNMIRQVQQRLKKQGFNPGGIDGTLGPQTQQALRWFQNSKGLIATGVLDTKTLDALGVR